VKKVIKVVKKTPQMSEEWCFYNNRYHPDVEDKIKRYLN
jgi:hypothetical protein